MIDLVINGGRVLDPARESRRVADVLIERGTIVDVVTDGDAPAARRHHRRAAGSG